MPRPIVWTPELDRALADRLVRRRVSLRVCERELGISRSVLAKRAYAIGAREVAPEIARRTGDNRSAAGREGGALAAGHPKTWGAVCECISGAKPAYPLPVYL